MQSIGPFAAPGHWLKGNLHTHSTASDGHAAAAAVCRHYHEAGYDFLCITDHFLERYGYPVTDTTAFTEAGFTTLLGAEVHVPATRHGDLWHLLAIGLPLGFNPPHMAEDAKTLARRCADAGAFVVLAHPAWSGLEVEDVLAIDAAHALEVFNLKSAVRTTRGHAGWLWDQCLVRGRELYAIAADDAHFDDQDWFGGWVQVKAPANAADAILDALKAGRFYASQGPVLEDVARDGERLWVRTSPVVRITALGAGAAQATRGGERLTEASFDLGPFRKGGFVRVVALDQAGKIAWANPIRLGL